MRLEQRNRLSALKKRLADAATHAEEFHSARVAAEAAERDAAAVVARARLAHGEAGRHRDKTRQAAAALHTQAAVGAARLASLGDQIAASQPEAEAEEAAAALAAAQEQYARAPDAAALRAALDRARTKLAAARARDAAARHTLDALARDDAARAARRRAVEFLWAMVMLLDGDLPEAGRTDVYRPTWMDLHTVPQARDRIRRLLADTRGR